MESFLNTVSSAIGGFIACTALLPSGGVVCAQEAGLGAEGQPSDTTVVTGNPKVQVDRAAGRAYTR